MLSLDFKKDTLSLTGSLDKRTSMQLWLKRSSFITANTKLLNINLSEISRIDTAGLATLIALFREANTLQIPISFLGATEQLCDLAKVSGVYKILPLR